MLLGNSIYSMYLIQQNVDYNFIQQLHSTINFLSPHLPSTSTYKSSEQHFTPTSMPTLQNRNTLTTQHQAKKYLYYIDKRTICTEAVRMEVGKTFWTQGVRVTVTGELVINIPNLLNAGSRGQGSMTWPDMVNWSVQYEGNYDGQELAACQRRNPWDTPYEV